MKLSSFRQGTRRGFWNEREREREEELSLNLFFAGCPALSQVRPVIG